MGQLFGEGLIDPVGLFMLVPPLFACGNAFFGTILLAVVVLFYNLVARLLGGVELVLKADTERSVAPAPTARALQQPKAPGTLKSDTAPPPPPPPVLGGSFVPMPASGVNQQQTQTSEPLPPRPVIETRESSTNTDHEAGTHGTTEESFDWHERIPPPPNGDRLDEEPAQEQYTDGADESERGRRDNGWSDDTDREDAR